MSPIYPGDRVRYGFAWNGVEVGTEGTFLDEREGLPGAFTVLVELDGGARERVPLAALSPVSPRPVPNPVGDLMDHILPGGVRVAEGRDPDTHAPRWTWTSPHTGDKTRLVWDRAGHLVEYRIVLDGPPIPTGRTIPTGPTRLHAHETACGVLQRTAADIPEPPHTGGELHQWLIGLPSRPRAWHAMFEFEGGPIGNADVVVAVCYGTPRSPLTGAVAVWNAGAVEVTNHTSRDSLRAHLVQIKEASRG